MEPNKSPEALYVPAEGREPGLRPRRRWGLYAGIGVAVIAVAGTGVVLASRSSAPKEDKQATKPPLEFRMADFVTPGQRKLRFDLSVPGTLQPVSQAIVRSKVSASVESVAVREGDPVAPGQVLVLLDTATLQAARNERAAALAQAHANLAQAEKTREQNAQLLRRNFIAQSAYDSADASWQAQAAAEQMARAQLEQAEIQLADARVRAPIGGRVARRFVQPGEKVGPDGQLLSIVDLSRLEVQAQAPIAEVARLQPGAPVDVEVEGLSGQRFRGVLERINPSADPGSRSINLYVALANDRQLLRAGMFATLRLNLESDRPMLTLPDEAVREEAGQRWVWVYKDGRLARRVVSTGRRDEQAHVIQMLGGVEAGDQVLASRFDDLRDGALATIATPKGTEAAASASAGAPKAN